jgi:hypothetical protein
MANRVLVFITLLTISTSAVCSIRNARTTTFLNLRMESHKDATWITTLGPNTPLRVVATKRGWYRVETPNNAGWVDGRYLVLDPPMTHLRVNAAVLEWLPDDFEARLNGAGVAVEAVTGDRYDDKPQWLLIAFGRNVLVSDIKAAVYATGPNPQAYLAPIGEDEYVGAIVIGVYGGKNKRVGSVQHFYDVLDSYETSEELAGAISSKGQLLK